MSKYDIIFEALQERVNSGELTIDEANKINDIAYEKYMYEKLETNIIDKTLARTMTLYHGSLKDLDTIKPCSINMGTRLSKVRLSSFWAKDKDNCIIWAAMIIFSNIGMPYKVSLKDKKIYTLDADYKTTHKQVKSYKHASYWIEMAYNSKPIFIYTLNDVPLKKIGHGQVNVDEYTLDEEVKPNKKEKVTFSTLRPFIAYLSEDEFKKKMMVNETDGKSSKDSSLMEKILFRNGRETMTKRSKLYHKAAEQYAQGKGNHYILDKQVFVPDLKSVK